METKKENSYKKTIWACYLVHIATAILINLTPVLFYFLKGLYNLDFSQLGTLIFVNFITVVIINIVFSKVVDKTGFRTLMIIGTIFAGIGLIIFSLSPFIFKNNIFVGFIISTIIFSFGGGLFQLLLSPIINSLPIEEKSGAMTKLHSFYAWGQIFTVLAATLLLFIINLTLGGFYWFLIPLIFSVIPFICLGLFLFVPLTRPVISPKDQSVKKTIFTPFFIIAMLAIFLCAATELIISQWASSYLESVVHLDKITGDILGVCVFAFMLGFGRILYAKYSKKANLSKLMLAGCITAAVCYIVIALSPFKALSLIAFGLTGLAVSLLWPGILSLTSEKYPMAGAWLFGILAAIGSIGSAVGPLVFGQIGDNAPKLSAVKDLAFKLSIEPFELGFRIAVLICVIFPLCAIFTVLYLHKKKSKKINQEKQESNPEK